MSEYVVTGLFKMGYKYNLPFKKTVSASSEKMARERALSLLGGCHGCKRRFITIKGVVLAEKK